MSVKTPKAFEYPGTVDDVTYTTETTQNKYGASGKRIERLEKGITTRYYYTGDALLYSTNEKNVLETENILDPAGSVIASKRFLDPSELGTEKYANKYYVFNYDARGSVTNVIAPNGSVVKGYDYDEFGNTEQKGEADFLNDITFTSSVADTSSNLQYMNSRFYQPSTGRFLSQDAYSGNAYDPWTQHLYTYCGNNPTTMVDPTGHFFLSAILIGALVGAVVGAGVVGYEDYKDDGKIFNGSKSFGDYVTGAAVGAVAGAAVGTVAAVAAGGTAVTAGLGMLGTMGVAAGSAGMITMGVNATAQAINKGITNVDFRETYTQGLKSAATSAVTVGITNVATRGMSSGFGRYKAPKDPTVKVEKANVGNKMEYLFGNATGTQHNVARSMQMGNQLNSIGIYNNANGRNIITNSLNSVLNDPHSISSIQSNGRIVRESLLTGPNGVLKMESIWEGKRLVTINLYGKSGNWFK